MEPRRGGPDHGRERVVHSVGGARGPLESQATRLIAHPVELVEGHLAERLGAILTGGREHEQVPQALQQVLDEAPGLVPCLDHALDDGEERGPVRRGEGVDGVVEEGAVGEAEQRDGAIVGDALRAGPSHQLVKHGKRVPNGPPSGAHDEGRTPARPRRPRRRTGVPR